MMAADAPFDSQASGRLEVRAEPDEARVFQVAGHFEADQYSRVVVVGDLDVDRPDAGLVFQERRFHLLLEDVRRRRECLVDVGEVGQTIVGQMLERACARIQDAPHVLLNAQAFERSVVVGVDRLAADLAEQHVVEGGAGGHRVAISSVMVSSLYWL